MIQLKDGHQFHVEQHSAAQGLYESEIQNTHDDLFIHNADGPIRIPRHAILFIAFVEDAKANQLYHQTQTKWDEITSIIGKIDDAGMEWFTDGTSTFIGSEEWKVSDDPHVAELLLQIGELEDQLETIRNGVMSDGTRI